MRELAPDLRPGLTAAMGPEADRVELREQRRSRWFLATRGAGVLGYGWLSVQREWIGEVRLEISPAAGEAYLWNCVTLPAHRRTGIFTSLLISVASRLQAEGLSRLWIASAGGAEKAVVNAGFARILRLRERRSLGLRWLTVRSAPGVDRGLIDAALAVLQVRGTVGGLPPNRRH